MPSGSQTQAEVQRLRDQMAQMQVSTAVVREAEVAVREVEAAAREAREAKQSKKYDELQIQLQTMMKMFQQPQNPPS
ncbi:hypothetical protein PVK06_008530 [Gossypium arboreum]|uniref:Uncharacterized protein n=1 Tax=Gossypium arboreum TaxID=29729 RepID=A0ABR0QL81_GOSAR|nr:hypothetical protein PVK06_008530 [Gossypium arboreum]